MQWLPSGSDTSQASRERTFVVNSLAQVKSSGLLEVTVLISGDHRRRNIPGVTFRRMRARFRNAVSPAISSADASSHSPSSNRLAAHGLLISNIRRRWRQGGGQSPAGDSTNDGASSAQGGVAQVGEEDGLRYMASPGAEVPCTREVMWLLLSVGEVEGWFWGLVREACLGWG